MKAYITTVGDIDSCCFAETRNKAKYATYKCLRDADCATESLAHTKIRIRRAPHLDHATVLGGKLPEAGRCYIPEYLELS